MRSPFVEVVFVKNIARFTGGGGLATLTGVWGLYLIKPPGAA